MTERPKLCVDCKHFRDKDYVGFQCLRNIYKEINLVTGLVVTLGELDPFRERRGLASDFVMGSSVETCGVVGKFWEPRQNG